MLLENKIAIVTGAAKGIGEGIALALAAEGCDIVVSDIDEQNAQAVAEEVKKMGRKAIAVRCDVSKKEEVENLFSKTTQEFGKLDILVNNAGIYPFKPFSQMEEADWDKVIEVNLKSVFLCSKEAAQILPEGGRIINISSIAASVGFEGLTHYCASKGAIKAMIRPLAVELAPRKITVNNVAPGAIETPGATGATTEEVKKQTIAMIPLARMGQPADIANAVVFLASNRADYITGQSIIVDGGWTLR